MKVVLATKLSVEECIKRLNNAIDPVPSVEERIRTAANTSLSPDPLPDAGRRMTGFGYSPGTRPVVGSIKDTVFHFEHRYVQSTDRGPNGRIVDITDCDGRLQKAPYGTLIELEMERPDTGGAFVVIALCISAFFGYIDIQSFRAYVTGAHHDTAVLFFLSLLFIVPLMMALTRYFTGKADGVYLLRFIKQVCRASALPARKIGKGEGYTGKTGPL